MSSDHINIEIIPSPRPETVEQERDYWYALYREVMTLLEPVTLGSSSATETLQRIIPELARLHKLEHALLDIIQLTGSVSGHWSELEKMRGEIRRIAVAAVRPGNTAQPDEGEPA